MEILKRIKRKQNSTFCRSKCIFPCVSCFDVASENIKMKCETSAIFFYHAQNRKSKTITYIHFEVVVSTEIHLKQKNKQVVIAGCRAFHEWKVKTKNIKHKKTMLLLLFVLAFGSGNFSAGRFPSVSRTTTATDGRSSWPWTALDCSALEEIRPPKM